MVNNVVLKKAARSLADAFGAHRVLVRKAGQIVGGEAVGGGRADLADKSTGIDPHHPTA